MYLYTIGDPAPTPNVYVSVLGMLIGEPESKFVCGQNRWKIVVMQKDNKSLVIKYTSHSADQDLHLQRLERYSGTIILLTMIDLSGLKQFREAEMHHSEDLVVYALEHQTVESINKFLKVWYQNFLFKIHKINFLNNLKTCMVYMKIDTIIFP